MKKLFSISLILLTTFLSFSQEITGRWYGLMDIMGSQMPFEFNITEENGKLSATMDSPDQKAFDIPISEVSFENKVLKLAIKEAQLSYEGKFIDEQTISGIFKQMGMEVALNLTKTKPKKTKINHPQEPQPPFSYRTEEIEFENKAAGIKLSGTLTLPAEGNKFPIVVLISGSGPQNRDSEMLGHKPFLLWADYLTKLGIAVLRYDERGIGKSGGQFNGSTSADFASDAEAAISYLKTRKDIDKKRIGLMGHSEGGIIAPMIAARNKSVKFIVLLAGTGIPGHELLLTQQELVARASGISESDIESNKKMNAELFNVIVNTSDETQMRSEMKKVLEAAFKAFKQEEIPSGMTLDEFILINFGYYTDPWMLYFLRYDPKTALMQVKCPVFAINGDKDLQVPAQVNLDAITQHLKTAKNKDYSTRIFPGVNHLLQECTTGSPEEYGKIEQTVAPQILKEVGDWIVKQTK